MQQTVFPCSVFSVHEVLVGKLMMDSGWRLKSRREKREINTRDSFHTVWSQSPDLRVFFFASSLLPSLFSSSPHPRIACKKPGSSLSHSPLPSLSFLSSASTPPSICVLLRLRQLQIGLVLHRSH